jgi:integrase
MELPTVHANEHASTNPSASNSVFGNLQRCRLAGWLGRELHGLFRERIYTAAGFSSRLVHDRHLPERRLDPAIKWQVVQPMAPTSRQIIVNLFHRWYRHLGFEGCSSHSGRRTFITNTARKILAVGRCLRDVQVLAGHRNLRTTERYIEANPEAQNRGVQQI